MRTVGTRVVYENAWIRVREDSIVHSDGTPGIYSVVERPTFALVIAMDGDRLHLVEQYRHPIGLRRWEFPQGTAPDHADVPPAVQAERELREETGLRAGRMIDLGILDIAPGLSTQRGRAYLALDVTEGAPERELEEQDMRSAWIPRDRVEAMMRDGEITDVLTHGAYLRLLLWERAQAAGLARDPGAAATTARARMARVPRQRPSA